MEGLGALGFWLMLGMVLAAGTVSRGLKERDKEREREATLRAMLGKDERTVTEVLAYLRERDAAERQLLLRLSGMDWQWPSGTRAVLAFLAVIAAGWFAGASLDFWVVRSTESAIPHIAMFVVWAAAPIVAWRVWRSSRQKHDAHPGA